ncbi:hypothetical protein BU15DRAFT_74736 [Melanogaster broomeanus]|nr:hypothetical protein BU15DRAFT_74736 [Melanogaster broomeanus]
MIRDVRYLIPFIVLAAGIVPPIDRLTNWMVSMAFPSVLWACRISILLSIVRAANPSRQLRRAVYFVGWSFVVMWVASLAQRIYICVQDQCKIADLVAIFQLITDVVSDFFLVALPVRLLRGAQLSRQQRILIFSVFSASLLITAVTILHSVVLLTSTSNGIIVIGHVKTALALVVCNLLVIVTFVYRVCFRDKRFRLDASEEAVEFTSVVLDPGTLECISTVEMSTKRSVLENVAAPATTTRRRLRVCSSPR